MRNRIGIGLLMVLATACLEQSSAPATSKSFAEPTVVLPERTYYKSLAAVVSESDPLKYWKSRDSYCPTLHFTGPDSLRLAFTGQCEQAFGYRLSGDSVVVYWNEPGVCALDGERESPEWYGNRPVDGKPFLSLRLVNDTTLQASYNHPNWAKRYNAQREVYAYLPEAFLSVGNYR